MLCLTMATICCLQELAAWVQSETQRIKRAGLSLEEQQTQLQELLHKVSAAVSASCCMLRPCMCHVPTAKPSRALQRSC